jgi:hypothetical protein
MGKKGISKILEKGKILGTTKNKNNNYIGGFDWR